ncbi:ankyrin repeat-containing domain protein [Aspergillus venezuelensis]
MVKILLRAGADVFHEGPCASPLTAACFKGREGVVACLLDEIKRKIRERGSITIDDDDWNGYQGPSFEFLRQARELVCNIRWDGDDRRFSLQKMLQMNDAEDALCRSTCPAFKSSIQGNRARIVELFLGEVGPGLLDFEIGGQNPLAISVQGTALDVVNTLLQHGVDPNKRSSQSSYALIVAARSGPFEISQALLSAGAYLDTLDDTARTPLSHAAELGQLTVGWSALEWAVDGRKSDIVNILQPFYEAPLYFSDGLAS